MDDTKKILKKVKIGKYKELQPGTLIGLNICPDCYSKLTQKNESKKCTNENCEFEIDC